MMAKLVPIPVNVQINQDRPIVRWVNTADFPKREPRFDAWVQRCGYDQSSDLVTSTLEHAEFMATETPRLAPTGFIFHMSRCGSTLVANLLSTIPGTCAVSEAQPLHSLLGSWPENGDSSIRQRLLRALVAGLAPPLESDYRFAIFKFVSSDIFALDLIRRSFPNVPWLFLCREPVEVMVSALRKPPTWLREWESFSWHKQFPDSDAVLDSSTQAEQRCAQMLRAFFLAAIAQGTDNRLIVPYEELINPAMPKILSLFNLPTDETIAQAMLAEAVYDAKDGMKNKRFTPDVQQKRASVSPQIQRLADNIVRPYYEQLLLTSRQS